MGAASSRMIIMNNTSMLRPQKHAFTLIEVLMVIAIVTVLLVLVGPSVQGVMSASRLRDAGDQVQNRILEAQMLAITLGTDTELRITKLPDIASADDTPYFRKLQVLALRPQADGTVGELEEVATSISLPANIMISPDQDFTSVAKLPLKAGPRSSDGAYHAFRFHPDGSTNLPPDDQWFLTLVERKPDSSLKLPENFITIQIDAVTGRLRTFQP